MAPRTWMESGWNTLARLGLLAFALSSVLFVPEFVAHVHGHFTGSISGDLITGQWHVVVFNIVLFTSFLFPLTFRRKADWAEYTIVSAFIISLFVEMYGVPFLLLFVAGRLGTGDGAALETPFTVEFLGVEFAFTVPMVYGSLLMVAGMLLIVVGWVQLYRGVQREELVTTGLYAVSRNPQYLGFMLVIVGWWVGWPTVLVTVFAPVLLVMYYRLCRREEGEIRDWPGFREYRERVPLVI